MTREPMRPERFAALLDAYGAEPRRWPDQERQAALEYLMTTPEARRLRAEAAELDRLLDTVPAAPPTAALRDRVLAEAPVRRSSVERRFVAGALAASLLLGFVVGATLQPQTPAGVDETDFLRLAQLDGSYQDF